MMELSTGGAAAEIELLAGGSGAGVTGGGGAAVTTGFAGVSGSAGVAWTGRGGP